MAYWFWIFIFYSLAGCFIERAYAHRKTGAVHPTRRCLLLLPLCPVYGLGMAAVLALPLSMRQGIWLPIAGAFIATAVEYVYHWVCDVLLGVKFWNYSGVIGNLRGRVCIPFSLAWGALIAFAVWLIQPPLAVLISSIPPIVTYICMLIFTGDLVCSLRVLAVTHSVAVLRREA